MISVNLISGAGKRSAFPGYLSPPLVRECRKCHTTRAITCFQKNRYGTRARTCAYCFKSHKDGAWWKNGIHHDFDTEEYARLLAEQGGGCAICGGRELGRCRHFSVDHDHATGFVRGLLCNNCNRAVGLFGDDHALLDRAAQYLRSASERKAAWKRPPNRERRKPGRKKACLTG